MTENKADHPVMIEIEKDEAERLISYILSEDNGLSDVRVRFWSPSNDVIDSKASDRRIHDLLIKSNYAFRCNFIKASEGENCLADKRHVFSSMLKNDRVILGSIYTSPKEAEITKYIIVDLLDRMPCQKAKIDSSGIE